MTWDVVENHASLSDAKWKVKLGMPEVPGSSQVSGDVIMFHQL